MAQTDPPASEGSPVDALSKTIVIPDGENGDNTISDNLLFIPPHYTDYVDSVLISNGLIQDRICKLARDIRQAYPQTTIHLMCVLKGGAAFFHDLQRHLRTYHDYISPLESSQSYIPFTLDFIKAKSYIGTESSGRVEVSDISDLSKLKNRHILLVEDMVDTGRTMQRLVPHLETHVGEKGSVRVASLFDKRSPLSCGYVADFTGFSIPNKFVVGYCLDYNEAYRDLNHVCVINDAGIEKFRTGVHDC